MKGSVFIALMSLVACVAAGHDEPSAGMIIQVKQEVKDAAGCNGGCCGNDCKSHPAKAWCHLAPCGVGVWVSEEAMTQDEAKDFCSKHGDTLLPITNADLFNDVIHFLREEEGECTSDFWVDGSDNQHEHHWHFSNGDDVPMGSPFWDLEYARPSYDHHSNCLAMQSNRNYYLRDSPCHYHNRAVCMCRSGGEPATPHPESCPADYTFVFDRCVRILPELVDDFEGGKGACLADGGHLLRLNSPLMLRSFYQHIEDLGETWSDIIFVDGELDGHGIFRYWDGTAAPLGSPYWEVGHPTGEADHLHFSTYSFLVNDVPCGAISTTVAPPTTPAPTTPAPHPGHHNHAPTGPFNVACELH